MSIKPVYYFVTLETEGKVPRFREVTLKTAVERKWVGVMRLYDHMVAEEYVVEADSLYALAEIRPGQQSAETVLEKAVAYFISLTQDQGPEESPLWSPHFKIRRISDEEELRSLREFIVQKMLGGEELSDW